MLNVSTTIFKRKRWWLHEEKLLRQASIYDHHFPVKTMTSQTAYVLTEGEYSDYKVIGVYSTKELAEEAKTLWPHSDIEDFPLDDIPEHPPGMYCWHGYVNEQMGIEELEQKVLKTNPTDRHWEQKGRELKYGRIVSFSVNFWATDEDHALKILQDKYHQHKAEKAGLA